MKNAAHHSIFLSLAFTAVTLFTTGCAPSTFTSSDPAEPPVQTSIGDIHGTLYGGQQPIVGAHIYLYAAATTGYGAASTSLLTSVTGVTIADASGHYYTTTSSTGTFTLTGDYTCTSGTQVYLYSIGGNPGAGTNSAAGQLAALGNCPASGSLAAQVPFLYVDEVSTVATAFALSGYAVDPTHIASSGTTLAKVGIANAISAVPNIINVGTGLPFTTTPNGNGTIPASKILALANILAACLNSSGPTTTQCVNLFADATADGTTTGAKPTDTAAAAINIAHNPAANVTALFNLVPPTGAAFGGALTVAPNDWTLAVSYTGGGLGASPHLAVDSQGNIWSTPNNTSVITKFSPLGVPLTGIAGNTTSGLAGSLDIAIDTTDQAVALGSSSVVIGITTNLISDIATVPNTGTGGSSVSVLNQPAAGTNLALDAASNRYFTSATTGGLVRVPSGSITATSLTGGGVTAGTNRVALDNAGYIWVTSANNVLSRFNTAGTAVSPTAGYTGGGLSTPTGLAFDPYSDAIVSNTANSISVFSSAGSALIASPGYTGGGLSRPAAVAIDGSITAFLANATGNSISEFGGAGTAATGTTGYTSTALSTPYSLVIDGSGNVWVGNSGSAALVEFVGLGSPVITPLVNAVKAGTLATRP